MEAGVAYAGIMELRRETEQLVEEIYARGQYGSREEVVMHAVQQLHERARVELPAGAPGHQTNRRKWTIVASLLQFAITAIAIFACAIDVESILFSGPALTLSAMATVVLARPLCSRRVMVYGLSAPLVCALGAFLIAIFNWGPGDAEEPILLLLTLYGIFVAMPAAIVAIPVVFRWQPVPDERRPFSWQFSLRSLLLVTTAACILIPILRYAFADPSPGDIGVFGTFILAAISLVGLSLFVFANDLRRRGDRRTCERPLEREEGVSA